MVSVSPFIIRLMHRPALPFNCRVKPEEIICIGISDMLRKAVYEKRLKAIWSHVPNEGKRHRLVALVMKAIGLISGTPDYFFIWPTGGGVVEIKAGKGALTDLQKDYQSWCEELGVHHAVCRSVAEVNDILVEWGALTN